MAKTKKNLVEVVLLIPINPLKQYVLFETRF